MKDKDDNSGGSACDDKNTPKSHRKRPRFFVTDENDLTWPVLFWPATGTAEGEK
jgi:hypothetical protein